MNIINLLEHHYHLPLSFFFFGFGAIWGSFINVVIYRIPLEMSLLRPRSHCPQCSTPIRWYDNIPIISYLILKGSCRHCNTQLSIRYPLVELICGVLAWTLFQKYGLNPILFTYIPFAFALIAITFIDIDHFIIPMEISYPGIVFGIIMSTVLGQPTWQESLFGILIGAGLLAFVLLAFKLLTGREGLGWGDVSLMAFFGAVLGISAIPAILFFGSLQGILIGGIWLLSNKGEQESETETDSPYVGNPKEEKGRSQHDQDLKNSEKTTDNKPEEELDEADFEIPAKAIPYGPFLSLAAIEWLFLQEYFTGIFWKTYWLMQEFIL